MVELAANSFKYAFSRQTNLSLTTKSLNHLALNF